MRMTNVYRFWRIATGMAHCGPLKYSQSELT